MSNPSKTTTGAKKVKHVVYRRKATTAANNDTKGTENSMSTAGQIATPQHPQPQTRTEPQTQSQPQAHAQPQARAQPRPKPAGITVPKKPGIVGTTERLYSLQQLQQLTQVCI